MYRNNVAVLDISSSNITAVVSGRGVNKTFSIKAVKSLKYSGFNGGNFYDVAELKGVILTLISYLEDSCGKKIKELNIGVPGDFTLVLVDTKQRAFARKRKINYKDINILISTPYKNDVPNYTQIKVSPIYFTINGLNKTVYPIGQSADSLSVKLSYYFCQNNFFNIIKDILVEADINLINFIPTSLAQSVYLISPQIRDDGALFADIGYISSTFTQVLGNGAIFQKSFSKGFGYIIAYIANALEIDFALSELILKRANLGISSKNSVDFEIEYGDEVFKYSANQVNSIIEYGFDEICEYISVCIEKCKSESDILLITGDGINQVRGGAEYIAKRLNINVQIIAPTLPYFNKPQHSSLISLLNAALFEKENNIFL